MVHWREQLAIVFSLARFSSIPFPSSAKVNNSNFHTGSGTHGHTDTFKRTVSLIKKQGKSLRYTCLLVISHQRNCNFSLCSRRLEVVGARKNGRARERHACLPLVRQFFLAPTNSKRLLHSLLQFVLNGAKTTTF